MIVLISLLSVCIMSYYLIVSDDYDDGVIGRGALCMLCFTSGLGFAQYLFGKVYFDPVSQTFFASAALFEGRHIYRIYKGKTKSDTALEVFKRIWNENWKPRKDRNQVI